MNIHICMTLVLCSGNLVQLSADAAAERDSSYNNPVIRGVNPDPSICRVDDDYYLATSSMFYYPGVPIYHSRDLIHWRLIGHALTTPEHFHLDKNNGNPMIYAPTLRYHEGTFYLITTDVHGGGNFYVITEDPAGEWSEPIFVDQPVFDPSLFFDEDGKVYFTRRGLFSDKDIVQAEIDIDTGVLLTPLRSVAHGMVSDDTEGPHLFRRGDWYYMTMGEGGSRFLHMQTIGRSKSPWGPFEPCPHNPVIAQHNAWWHPIKSLGHADFIEAHDGSWWVVCLGTRHAHYGAFSNIGRETFLFPVDWVDDWPVIQPEFQQQYQIQTQTLPLKPWPAIPVRDNFDSDTLGLHWTLLAYPHEQVYDLHSRPGYLRLHGRVESLETGKQVAFVGSRQTEMHAVFSTKMEFTPESENEEAGISVFVSNAFHYDFYKSVREAKQVVVIRKSVGDITTESHSTVLENSIDPLQLRVVIEPTQYLFEYREEGKDWTTLGTGVAQIIATEVADVWSGTMLALYSTGNGQSCVNPADFAWSEYVVHADDKS